MMYRVMNWASAAVVAVFALVAVGATPALADYKPPVVAVVNFQQILNESVAGKGARKVIEGHAQALQKEISGQEAKLRQSDQDLARQRSTMSEDAFNRKRVDLQKQFNDFQSEVQKRQKALQQGEGEALRTIEAAINDIIGGLAHERGINLVLPRSVVPFSDPDLDLTAVVLDRLNDKLPSVAVNIPNFDK